ncbi:MAG TPA: hypothetical protein VMY35_15875 [Phycisphaerae bacterium]|nr:hypothetical protein [Phycisphaerae bacterium]
MSDTDELALLRAACDRIRAAMVKTIREFDEVDADEVGEWADQLVMAAHPIRVERGEG